MFGDKLKSIRLEKSWDQETMADVLGVTNGTVSNWENGKFLPNMRSCIKISAAFPSLKDELLEIIEQSELAKVKQELEEVKAERDVWKKTTFDLLKEKQQWQQSSGV